MRIGPYPGISLKAARDIRDEQKRLLYADGINPCDAKKRSKDHRWGRHAQLTFEAVASDWHATKTARTWTDSTSFVPQVVALGGEVIDAAAHVAEHSLAGQKGGGELTALAAGPRSEA